LNGQTNEERKRERIGNYEYFVWQTKRKEKEEEELVHHYYHA
jgi:hypothetical protein